MKKLLFFLSACLLLTVALITSPKITPSAATSDCFTYSVTNNEAKIIGISDSIWGDVVIPSTLGGYPVTSIGDNAFYRCSSVTSITIPSSIKSMGIDVFLDCTRLKSVHISDIAAWCKIYFQSSMSNPMHYADNLYLNGELITDLVIPNSVTSIQSCAFWQCSNLTSVTIPDSVTSIGSSAFKGCTSLKSITIPNSVTSIGSSAFSGCSNLESITLPFVGNYRGASGSETSTLGYIFGSSSFSGEGKICQYYSRDKKVYCSIPSSLKTVSITDATHIPYGAFSNCANLVSVTISDTVTKIDDSAFKGCTSLENLTVPFVGYSREASGTANSVFGFVFGNGGVYQSYQHGSYGYDIPSSLKTVTITDDTGIGYGAFSNCSNIKNVNLSESVLGISNKAFWGCSSLENIAIPNSVYEIRDEAFYGCSSLINITVHPKNAYYESKGECLIEKASKKLILGCKNSVIPTDGSVISIGKYAFGGNEGLESITIPNGVTSIDNYAFVNCENLKSITIPFVGQNAEGTGATYFGYIFGASSHTDNRLPDGLKEVIITDGSQTISEYAFYKCSKITSITIPNSVKSLGDYAFYECARLESFVIPESVTSIGEWAFYNCTSLKGIKIPDSVTDIGESAFYNCAKLENISLGNGVKNIGDSAFYSCGMMKTLIIPNSVISIGGYAFFDCSALENIYFGNGVTNIGKSAFSFCDSLNSVYISDMGAWCAINFKDIDSNPFCYANNLYLNNVYITDLVIPEEVSVISSYAFSNCIGLQSITIPNSVTYIGEAAFYNCNGLKSITLPFVGSSKTATGTYDSVFGYIFGCSEEPSDDKVRQYYNSDSSLYYYIPSSLKTVLIADETDIPFGAFYGCSNITDISIPYGIKKIEDYAFYGCSGLTTVVIPDSVIKIGAGALGGCDNLKNLTIPFVGENADGTGETSLIVVFDNDFPDSLKEIILSSKCTSIPDSAFSNCDNAEKIVIPNGVVSIGKDAFYRCSGLKSLIIPDSVTTIDSNAFYACSSLENLIIPNSVTYIGKSAFRGCNSLHTLSIPFVGEKADGTGYTNFGFWFGASITEYPYQYHKNFVPTNLKKVIITGNYDIPDNAFYECVYINEIVLNGRPEAIGELAFAYCSELEIITIAESIKEIKNNAFYDCLNLFQVYYGGTKNQRQNIFIAHGNKQLLDYASWHYLGVAEKNGWHFEGADWYYYENGNKVVSDWRKDSKGWVYLGKDGAMLTNAWCTDSAGWCYVGADGYAVTNCWKKDSIGWCYLGANGSQVKNNWVLDGGKWYFINANGYMVSNQWRKDSKGWVYLGSSGAMLTNAWCTDSQGWCYVGADGYAVTNCWKKDSIGWIWLNGSGSMTKSAWVFDCGSWYYLDSDGYMLSSTSRYISNKTYYFNASGVCTNP